MIAIPAGIVVTFAIVGYIAVSVLVAWGLAMLTVIASKGGLESLVSGWIVLIATLVVEAVVGIFILAYFAARGMGAA